MCMCGCFDAIFSQELSGGVVDSATASSECSNTTVPIANHFPAKWLKASWVGGRAISGKQHRFEMNEVNEYAFVCSMKDLIGYVVYL